MGSSGWSREAEITAVVVHGRTGGVREGGKEGKRERGKEEGVAVHLENVDVGVPDCILILFLGLFLLLARATGENSHICPFQSRKPLGMMSERQSNLLTFPRCPPAPPLPPLKGPLFASESLM